MIEQPPLPDPENPADSDGCTYSCPEGYSSDQMRAYGKVCADAATECAAQICDQMVMALDKGGKPYRRPADADQCAAAIRGG